MPRSKDRPKRQKKKAKRAPEVKSDERDRAPTYSTKTQQRFTRS